jgi:hypothetical protein
MFPCVKKKKSDMILFFITTNYESNHQNKDKKNYTT